MASDGSSARLYATLDNDPSGAMHQGDSSFYGGILVRYKEFKTYTEQRALLIGRGLIIDHPRFFTNALQKDDYYNIINGYKKYFLSDKNPERYFSGTTFEQIYALYSFDQNIRALFLVELLKIEKNLKALIAYHFSEKHGYDHNLYLDVNNFKNKSHNNRKYAGAMIARIYKDITFYSNKGNAAICHYMEEYGYIPLWVLNSVLSFGRIAHFYSCMNLNEQQAVSNHFSMSASTLDGFMYFLDDFRNTCAHGARVYTSDKTAPFQRLAPDTLIHQSLGIPKNSAGNYVMGKTDVLAKLISLKCFLGKSDFRQTKKRFKKYYQKLETSIPNPILQRIDREMGMLHNHLPQL